MEESRSGAWRSAIGALALALLLWPGAAWAQPAADDEAEAEAQEERDEPEGVEEIVVTGSRIRRDAFTSALPITVITAERATLAGLADTADILQSSSLASGTQIDNTFGGFIVSGGPGANTFGLRGLGPTRTLVLVNGRRFTPAGVRGQVSSVDLNSIPRVAIARFEILKDGASSVYGADAVAGVVNIITRKQFDELSISVRRFDKERDASDISLSWGKTGDRGYMDFALEYSNQSAIKRSERDWAHCNHRTHTDGGAFPSIFPGTSGGRVSGERCFGTVYGTVFAGLGGRLGNRFFGFNPQGSFGSANLPFSEPFVQIAPGRFAVNVGNLAYRDDRDWFNADLIPQESLIQFYGDGERDFDLDRVGWLGPVGDFFGTVTGNFELYYSRRGNNRTGGYRPFFPDVSTRNPTAMQLGEEILRYRQQLLIALSDPGDPTPALGTLENDLPTLEPNVIAYELLSPQTRAEVSTYAIRGGFGGDLGRFHWEFIGGYSFSRGSWTYETWLKDRVARSLSAERNADGSLSCVLDRTQLTAAAERESAVVNRILSEGEDPNCVAVDLFSEDAMLNGRLPANARDYLADWVRVRTSYDLATLDLEIEGALFDMPFGGGEVRGVFGLTWRSRALDDIPPRTALEDNQWGFASGNRTKGDDTVQEAYAEIEFPLLEGFAIGGISVAEELTFNASGRYTDQSSYGSDTTFRGLLTWAINPIVRLRAAFGTSFRAPSLYQFHLAQNTGFVAGGADPCDSFDTDIPGSVAYDNCQDLVDRGVIDPDFSSSGLLVISGGNPDLKAETSESLTVGLVLTPDLAGWLPALGLDLSLAVDFYDIQIEEAIDELSAGVILNRCYASVGLTAPECSLIGPRDAMSGEITRINSNFINIAEERSSGFDITLRTEREFSFGELSVDMQGSRIISTAENLTGDNLQEYKGHHAYPRWRGEADISFERKAWRVNWSINYIGHTSEDPVWCRNGCTQGRNAPNPGAPNPNPGATNLHTASAAFFHNAWVTYRDPQERFLVSAGVRNLFNETPPVLGWAPFGPAEFATVSYNIPIGSGYDAHGRRAYVNLLYSF
ncbi:MAG: TonB-dependent receptor [Deltaproteobacteria bacterium]|nr:TonB-dependent receptor [Deltaproteobacteria bacterium]